MAEKRPTRASGRLNSEQPNPNPIEGSHRRARKAQGKESNDAERSEPSTRITRGSSVESGLSNGRRVARKTAKGPAQRLSTVAESARDQYPNLDPQLVELSKDYVASRAKQENTHDDDVSEALQQEREASSASAVTAQTSFSQRELEALDRGVMLDALPDLYQAASNVIHLVLSGVIASQVRQLTDEESRVYKNLRRLGKVHIAQKEDFSSGLYIDLRRAQRGILGAQEEDDFVDHSTIGLLDVFFLSNLASLLFAIFTNGRRREILEKLNSDFAGLSLVEVDFPRQNGYDEDGFRARTLNLALDIRTQYCMVLLKQEIGENYDPDQIIHECFYNALEGEDAVLRGWDTTGLKAEDLLPNEHQRILERMKVIQEVSQDLDNEDIVKPYKDVFEWAKLQINLLEWAKLRSEEIEAEVNHLGGVETIRIGIESLRAQRLQRARSDRVGPEDNVETQVALEYSPSNVSYPPTDTAKLASSMQLRRELHTDPRAVALLLGNLGNAGLQGSDGHGESIRTAEAALKAANNFQAEYIEEDQFSEQSRHPLSTLSHSHEIGLAEQNKENIPEMQPAAVPRRRLIDPQPGASRITFDTQEPSQAGPSTKRAFRNPDQIGNHPESEYLPEPSQDEGFQTDTRPSFQTAPIPNMRRSGEESTPTRPSKRQRRSRTTPRARPAPRAAPATPQAQTLEALGENPTPSQLYAHVATQSRLIGSQHQKPRKVKEPWTNDEINALVDYIATFGFLCGKIKEVDEGTEQDPGPRRLTRRDNVALKDKARNMKMDYLRSQIELPMNFVEVPLNKALDQRLRDAGIEPPPVRRGGELIA